MNFSSLPRPCAVKVASKGARGTGSPAVVAARRPTPKQGIDAGIMAGTACSHTAKQQRPFRNHRSRPRGHGRCQWAEVLDKDGRDTSRAHRAEFAAIVLKTTRFWGKNEALRSHGMSGCIRRPTPFIRITGEKRADCLLLGAETAGWPDRPSS